jgi:hypothetical protein
MPAKWRAHKFHATTVVSQSSAVDNGAISVVRYEQVTFLRLFPCDGRHQGVNGGSLLRPSPLTLAVESANTSPGKGTP